MAQPPLLYQASIRRGIASLTFIHGFIDPYFRISTLAQTSGAHPIAAQQAGLQLTGEESRNRLSQCAAPANDDVVPVLGKP